MTKVRTDTFTSSSTLLLTLFIACVIAAGSLACSSADVLADPAPVAWTPACIGSDCGEICAVTGLCGKDPQGGCWVATPAGCMNSERCGGLGACAVINGTCSPGPGPGQTCEQARICQMAGQCTPSAVDNSCAAESDEKCANSEFCTVRGACSLVGKYCGAGSDQDCMGSQACIREGLCSRGKGGICEAGGPHHCQASLACKLGGECDVASEYGNAVCRSKTAVACSESLACKTLGWCHWDGHKCRPQTDDHCRATDDCKLRNWCAAARYSRNCVTPWRACSAK